MTLTNGSGSDGYISFRQRGKGVYFDAPLEMESRDDALIAVDGERGVSVQQKYKTQPSFAKIAAIVTRRKVKRGDLLRVTMAANLDYSTMQLALGADVGALLHIVHAPANLDGYYWVQARDLQLQGRQVSIAWTLQQHFGSVI